jgi:hypothetical protein
MDFIRQGAWTRSVEVRFAAASFRLCTTARPSTANCPAVTGLRPGMCRTDQDGRRPAAAKIGRKTGRRVSRERGDRDVPPRDVGVGGESRGPSSPRARPTPVAGTHPSARGPGSSPGRRRPAGRPPSAADSARGRRRDRSRGRRGKRDTSRPATRRRDRTGAPGTGVDVDQVQVAAWADKGRQMVDDLLFGGSVVCQDVPHHRHVHRAVGQPHRICLSDLHCRVWPEVGRLLAPPN